MSASLDLKERLRAMDRGAIDLLRPFGPDQQALMEEINHDFFKQSIFVKFGQADSPAKARRTLDTRGTQASRKGAGRPGSRSRRGTHGGAPLFGDAG